MYNYVTAETLLQTINNGYFPVWFSIENEELIVDMCVDYRLTDGKVLFMKVKDNDLDTLVALGEQVADTAAELWAKSIAKRKLSLREDLEIMKKAQANCRSVDWKVDHVYTFIYNKDHKELYICDYIEIDIKNKKHVYLKKLIEKEYVHLVLFKSEATPVEELVNSETIIIDEGCQPGRTTI